MQLSEVMVKDSSDFFSQRLSQDSLLSSLIFGVIVDDIQVIISHDCNDKAEMLSSIYTVVQSDV
jgi:hypothetical protein